MQKCDHCDNAARLLVAMPKRMIYLIKLNDEEETDVDDGMLRDEIHGDKDRSFCFQCYITHFGECEYNPADDVAFVEEEKTE